jgi:hypothetical protein
MVNISSDSEVRASPLIDRAEYTARKQARKGIATPILSCAIIGLMLAAGLFFMVDANLIGGQDQQNQAKIAANNGQREVSYSYDHFFESYLKTQNYSTMNYNNAKIDWLGHHGGTAGLGSWFTTGLRNTYDEFVYRNAYPFILYATPYSVNTAPDFDAGFYFSAPLRMSYTAKNVTDIRTTNDAIFIPQLGNPADNGGYINMTWYGTYLTTTELTDIRAGTNNHYANRFYGVPNGVTPASNTDDGYYFELQGVVTFTRQAAVGYLGAPASGDLRPWFNGSRTTLVTDWTNDWITEGSGGGTYDIYTAYDYDEDIQYLELALDATNSTNDFLTVRTWSVSWGMEAQMVRYMEAANFTKHNQGWYEDMYLNVSVSPNMSNATFRGVDIWGLSAGEDNSTDVFSAAWTFDICHLDACGNELGHMSYTSPFNPYDPEQTDWTVTSYSPGTTRYGLSISYDYTPEVMDLAEFETVTVDITTKGDVIGITPYRGTSDNIPFNNPKKAEIAGKLYWGTLVLGDDNDLAIRDNYSAATKKIVLKGPMQFTTEGQVGDPTVLLSGAPAFTFDVSRVSYYQVTVTGAHTTTMADIVKVVAKNSTGVTVTAWNGTVDLDSTDGSAAWGANGSSHAFIPANNGVWWTSITWDTGGAHYLNATDLWFSLDVTGSNGPIVVLMIPEFPDLMAPMAACMAVALAFILRRRRSA